MTAHWFYRTTSSVEVWKPFSVEDSTAIEAAFERGGAGPVAVEGTRCVDLVAFRGILIHLITGGMCTLRVE